MAENFLKSFLRSLHIVHVCRHFTPFAELVALQNLELFAQISGIYVFSLAFAVSRGIIVVTSRPYCMHFSSACIDFGSDYRVTLFLSRIL